MAKDTKLVRSLAETLEIAADRRLFRQILKAAATLKEDARLGKLHSFEEAFNDSGPSARPRPRR
jgi:hypothetical protein